LGGGPAQKASGSSGWDDRDPAILRLMAHRVASTYVDLGATGDSQADQFVFTNDLFSGGA
jgi:hypothetical protein